ncbi:MAG: hypothetical protein M0Q88_00900 [Bacilli bacterium]|nr:hypothetical protein [Bacilli bacterium]
MKVYIYFDKSKPPIDLIYNVLAEDVELEKIEIEAESSEAAVQIFNQMLENGEI